MSERDNSYLVLVVDDSDCHRELLSVFLGVLGYNVIEAADGLEAVKIATSSSPDLIIMDLSMPVMDGYGAVQILRQVPETAAVPIVACTAHDISTHRAQALSVGFNDILTKPIDFTKLNFVIGRFLKAA
jgi:CheY-like chemotaxis protein